MTYRKLGRSTVQRYFFSQHTYRRLTRWDRFPDFILAERICLLPEREVDVVSVSMRRIMSRVAVVTSEALRLCRWSNAARVRCAFLILPYSTTPRRAHLYIRCTQQQMAVLLLSHPWRSVESSLRFIARGKQNNRHRASRKANLPIVTLYALQNPKPILHGFNSQLRTLRTSYYYYYTGTGTSACSADSNLLLLMTLSHTSSLLKTLSLTRD